MGCWSVFSVRIGNLVHVPCPFLFATSPRPPSPVTVGCGCIPGGFVLYDDLRQNVKESMLAALMYFGRLEPGKADIHTWVTE